MMFSFIIITCHYEFHADGRGLADHRIISIKTGLYTENNSTIVGSAQVNLMIKLNIYILSIKVFLRVFMILFIICYH